MKYRTLLTDPHKTPERPVQAFHPNQTSAREWAVLSLANASPDAYVVLYAEVEVELHIFRQQPKEPAKIA